METIDYNLETERLILRELNFQDTKALLPIFSDPKTMYFTDTEPMKTLEEVKELVDFVTRIRIKKTGNRWGIFLKTNHQLIGTCGYHLWDKQSHNAEIGYEIGSAYWRNGYMGEALPIAIQFGFEVMNLNRIEAYVFPGNDKSMNLLGKYGFQKEGLRREGVYCKGKYWDEWSFSLLKRDWENR